MVGGQTRKLKSTDTIDGIAYAVYCLYCQCDDKMKASTVATGLTRDQENIMAARAKDLSKLQSAAMCFGVSNWSQKCWPDRSGSKESPGRLGHDPPKSAVEVSYHIIGGSRPPHTGKEKEPKVSRLSRDDR